MKNEEDTSASRLPDRLKKFSMAMLRKLAGLLLLLLAAWCASMFFYKPWKHIMIVRLRFLAAAGAFAVPGFNLFSGDNEEEKAEKEGS